MIRCHRFRPVITKSQAPQFSTGVYTFLLQRPLNHRNKLSSGNRNFWFRVTGIWCIMDYVVDEIGDMPRMFAQVLEAGDIPRNRGVSERLCWRDRVCDKTHTCYRELKNPWRSLSIVATAAS